jgi:hypothetical protein
MGRNLLTLLLGGIREVAVGFRQRLESLGKVMMHPLLSRRFDDRLSVLLIRSSTSLIWNIIALGALLSFVALFLLDLLQRDSASSLAVNSLISYAVIGVVWNAFAAMAHSARSGSYSRGLLLFAIWPLSYAYNWREMLTPFKPAAT